MMSEGYGERGRGQNTGEKSRGRTSEEEKEDKR